MKYILIVFAIFAFFNTNAQGCDSNLVSFQREYGGNLTDEGHSIYKTIDNGYIAIGRTNSFGAGDYDFIILKLNSLGSLMWSKVIGGTNEENGSSIKIIQASDSNYYFVGVTKSFNAQGYDPMVVKLDVNGNILWQNILSGNNNDHIRDIIELSNGDLLLCGTSNSFNVGGSDVYVLRISKNGNIIWSKTLGGNTTDHGTSAYELSNNNILLSCQTASFGAGSRDGMLMEIDQLGNVVWSKTYGLSNDDALIYTMEHNNNLISLGHLDVSFNNKDILLTKLDSVGNIIWSKTYGTLGYDRGIKLIVNKDGYLLANYSDGFFNQPKILLIQTDFNGNIIWSKVFGGNQQDEFVYWGNSIALANDSSFTIIGSTNSFKTNKEIYIIKTDECGNSGCFQFDSVVVSQNTNIISFNAIINSTQGGNFVPVNSSVVNISLFDSTICFNSPVCYLTSNFTSNNFCLNDTTVFNDLSVDSIGNIINWYWDFGDGTTTNGNPNPTHTYGSDGLYNVTLIVENDYGCTDTLSQSITINPLPTVTIVNDTAICTGNCVTISAGGGISYEWSPANSLNDSTLSNPTACPSSTTNYTVNVTDVNGCSDTGSVLVTVNPLPVVNAGPDISLCIGDSIQIGGSPTGPSGATYSWAPSVALNNTNIPNPTSGATVNTTYIVTVTDSNLCVNTDTMDLTINPLPIVEAGNDTSTCIGNTANLGGNPTGPSGAAFVWNPGNTLNDSTIANPTATPNTTTTYIVTVTDINGCVNTDSVMVTVNLLPAFTITNDTTLCIGDTIQLNATYNINYSYLWTPNVNINNPNINNPTATINNAIVYTLQVTDTTTGCLNTDSVSISLYDSILFIGNDTTLCLEESLSIIITNFTNFI